MAKIYVINSQGEKEPFSWKKIYLSAQRVGAPKPLARQVANRLEREVYENIPTKEIFRRIRRILLKEERPAGIRFNLKEAIRRLGPSGFTFEKYVAAIFESLGYTVQTNQMIPGQCVVHEIDFLAKKEKEVLIGECKFHHLPGLRVDLKVALGDYARFLDLKSGIFFRKTGLKTLESQPIIVTNTKFSTQAIRYARCMGIKLLGWRYPEREGLEYLIELNKLYPITVLPSLKAALWRVFFQEGLMLARDLLEPDFTKLAERLNIAENKLKTLRTEAAMLLH